MQTKAGGIKAAQTLKQRNPNYYSELGKKGGSVKTKKGWGANHELAVRAGKIGGAKSRRGPKAWTEEVWTATLPPKPKKKHWWRWQR